MARRLASALSNELKSDPRFTLSSQGTLGALNISFADRVGWERRLDWTRISYQARLTSPSGRSSLVTGNCWSWNLRACAKQVANAAAQFGVN
jgi:hypothetical protein